MKFEYNGTTYNTDSSEGRLQLTKDVGLKKALITAWFGEDVLGDHGEITFPISKLDLLYEIALLEAKYERIISEVTGGELSKAGTYPEWVIKTFKREFERPACAVVDVNEILETDHTAEDKITEIENYLLEFQD
ncbi:hypothetical protein [Latilactobacillus sakei]|uniref:hypothetical protein n=1 Tax=Latilactobacillus sakei TaxID=1599 RepID=UPI001BD43B43|nr:hypothetical protein [Latilactobacillus sakei]QVQ49086.1 hypothetical protein KIK01_00750 [Latilactobacillus sakei subsp. sakei]